MTQCRACLDTKAEEFVQLNMLAGDDMNLYDYFNECTQLNAMADDELPQTLCSSCSQNLLTAFHFIHISRQADQTLRLYLEQEGYADDPNAGAADSSNESMDLCEESGKCQKNTVEECKEDPLAVASFRDIPIADFRMLLSDFESIDAGDSSFISSVSSVTFSDDCADDDRTLNDMISTTSSISQKLTDPIDDATTSATQDSSQQISKKRHPKSFDCMYCDEVFAKKYKMKEHLREAHRSKLLCKKCAILFNMPKDLELHNSLVHSKSTPVQCQYCPEASPIPRDQLAQHFRSKHCSRYHRYFPVVRRKGIGKATPYLCKVCRRYFPSAAALCKHQKTHPIEPYLCPYCGMEFKKRPCLALHQQQKHSEVYAAESKAQLDDANKPLPCGECSRVFKSLVALEAHEEGFHSSGLPRINCKICGSEMNIRYLATHMKLIHAEPRKYVCDVCGNPFKGPSQLHTHKKLHMEREFECIVCRKQYTRQSDLKVHMRSHTGEQPYECYLCDKKFAMKVRLTYHLQMHAGIRHRCEQCGKEFSTLQSLKDHMYKHNGMPYQCEECGYGNIMRETFARHMSDKHKITLSADDLNVIFKKNTGRLPHIPTAVKF